MRAIDPRIPWLLLLLLAATVRADTVESLRDGDIVFHTTNR